MKLKDKVALVTGAARHTRAEIALLLEQGESFGAVEGGRILGAAGKRQPGYEQSNTDDKSRGFHFNSLFPPGRSSPGFPAARRPDAAPLQPCTAGHARPLLMPGAASS